MGRSAADYHAQAAELLGGLDHDDYRVRLIADLMFERDATDSQTARATLTRSLAARVAELRPPEADVFARALTWPEIAERIARGIENIPADHLAPILEVVDRRRPR